MKNEQDNKQEQKPKKVYYIAGALIIALLVLVFFWQQKNSNSKLISQESTVEESITEESVDEGNNAEEQSSTNEESGTGEDVEEPLLIDTFMGTFEEMAVGEPANNDSSGSSKEEWVEVFGEPSRVSANNDEGEEVITYTWIKPVQDAENSVLTVRFNDNNATTKSVIGLASEGTDIANASVFDRIPLGTTYYYKLSKQDLGQPDGITENKSDGKIIRTVSWIAKSGDGQGANMTIIFEDSIAIDKSDSGLM
ncbi:DUF3862 domain-containing protein [Aerococcus sp. L_32]|uniref:DUF3862 domain-containing protein n=1 Tax=Aerococcus sp. L_32 TaxID=3422316 RepID=UPI003D6B3384